MHKLVYALVWAVPCTLILPGCQQPAPEYEEPEPLVVKVSTPAVSDVTLFIEANGETEAVVEAEIRSRVRGFIEEIPFEPGQEVTPETILYVIEQTEYENKLDAAEASLSSAESSVLVAQASVNTVSARVAQAEAELSRQQQLLETNATSRASYEAALADRDSAVADLEASQASVELAKSQVKEAQSARDQAQLDFDYTTIRSPISGFVSESKMDLGNLVENGSSLATVVDNSQTLVRFTISDRKLLSLLNSETNAPREEKQNWRGHPVFARRQTDKDWISGSLDYVDQEGIDRDTGTFSLRAVIENDERKFVPGMFVDVRLPYAELNDALMIPEQALVKTPVGNYAFVVAAANKLEQRELLLGQQLDGWVLVESGLEASDQVVIQGLQFAVPGREVTPETIELSLPDSLVNQDEGLDGSEPNDSPSPANQPE